MESKIVGHNVVFDKREYDIKRMLEELKKDDVLYLNELKAGSEHERFDWQGRIVMYKTNGNVIFNKLTEKQRVFLEHFRTMPKTKATGLYDF